MPVGKMIQQVIKSENVQFFFQQFSTLRTDTFQVFNGAVQYVVISWYKFVLNKCTIPFEDGCILFVWKEDVSNQKIAQKNSIFTYRFLS